MITKSESTADLEPTPVWDGLLAELGDPVVRPPVDRSYEALVEQAERMREGLRHAGAKAGEDSAPSATVSLVKPTDSGAEPTTDQDGVDEHGSDLGAA